MLCVQLNIAYVTWQGHTKNVGLLSWNLPLPCRPACLLCCNLGPVEVLYESFLKDQNVRGCYLGVEENQTRKREEEGLVILRGS